MQAGYLTIHDVEKGINALTLNYPNEEVALHMRRVYNYALFGQGYGTVLHGSAYSIFEKDSLDEIFSKLNCLFERIDYQRFPIKDEATLKVIMQLYLEDGGIELEKHNDDNVKDSSILEFKAGNKYYVIEHKYAKEKDDTQKLLETTKAQIKEWFDVVQGNEANLLRMILVYLVPKRMFTSFERVA